MFGRAWYLVNIFLRNLYLVEFVICHSNSNSWSACEWERPSRKNMANCYLPRLTYHICRGPHHFVWTVSLGLLVSIRLSDASSFSSSSWLGWLSSFFQGHIRNLPSYLSGEIIFRINKCRWYRNHKEPQANLLLTRTEMAVIHRNASIKEWTGRLVGGKELDENFSFRKKGTCTFSPYRLFLHH